MSYSCLPDDNNIKHDVLASKIQYAQLQIHSFQIYSSNRKKRREKHSYSHSILFGKITIKLNSKITAV